MGREKKAAKKAEENAGAAENSAAMNDASLADVIDFGAKSGRAKKEGRHGER